MGFLVVYTKCACITLILKCKHPYSGLVHGVAFQAFDG